MLLSICSTISFFSFFRFFFFVCVCVLLRTKIYFQHDYLVYQLANNSLKMEEKVFSTIAKLGKKVKSRMKPHYFNPEELISIIGFLQNSSSRVTHIEFRKEPPCRCFDTTFMRHSAMRKTVASAQKIEPLRSSPQCAITTQGCVNSFDHIRRRTIISRRSMLWIKQ